MTSHISIDPKKLSQYLNANVEGFEGPISLEKFSGGQSNPTYLIDSPSSRYVLRCRPPGKLLRSAHAIDREYRVMSSLSDTSVPVPRVHAYCDDERIIGSTFYIMDFIDGRIFWDPALHDCTAHERLSIYSCMNSTLADLHDIDVTKVSLNDFGKQGKYFERQLRRWTQQYRSSAHENLPTFDRLLRWLEVNLPPDDGQVSLIHGDYRLDNIIFAKSSNNIVGVLDWELSTLGDPFSDLAYQCMQLRIPHDAVFPGLGGLNRTNLGIPTEEEYVARYCARRGIDGITHWKYFLAFSFFRLSVILLGIYQRSLNGNASNEKAAEYGALAIPLSEMGLNMIESD